MDRFRGAGTTLLTLLVLAVFAVATFLAVDLAKGGFAPDNSNTPNATRPGPPDFK